jgi:hypothetical protein
MSLSMKDSCQEEHIGAEQKIVAGVKGREGVE